MPLGYEPDGRSLKIVEEHAALIRDIYDRYRQLGDSGKVADALRREGIEAPQRLFRNGRSFGGCALSRGNIAAILKNPVYAGDIAHKEQIFAGNHPAIIDREQWDAAQQQRKANTKGQRSGPRPHHSLLAGLLSDENGKALCPSHTTKGSHRYRYYVSQPDDALPASARQRMIRIPAREIEQVVRQEVGRLLADPLQLFAEGRIRLVPSQLTALEARGKELAAMLTIGGFEIVRMAVTGVVVHPERLTVKLSLAGLGELFGLPDVGSGTFDHSIPVTIRRSGRVAWFVDQNGAPRTSHGSQRSLAGLLSTARVWWGELSKGEVDVATLARAENVCPSSMTRVVRLAFLAPEVVDAILVGQVRADLDGGELLATGSVDLRWDRQNEQLLTARFV